MDLQASLTAGITGYGSGIDTLASSIITNLQDGGSLTEVVSSGMFGGLGALTSVFMVLFIIIMMGYAVIKVFFSNLKRGGILLIQIAVGSLHMFSVPRGYGDRFVQWFKQVAGLCLTTYPLYFKGYIYYRLYTLALSPPRYCQNTPYFFLSAKNYRYLCEIFSNSCFLCILHIAVQDCFLLLQLFKFPALYPFQLF